MPSVGLEMAAPPAVGGERCGASSRLIITRLSHEGDAPVASWAGKGDVTTTTLTSGLDPAVSFPASRHLQSSTETLHQTRCQRDFRRLPVCTNTYYGANRVPRG